MRIDSIEALLESKEGFEFQAYCERYLSIKFGEAFQKVSERRDLGKDGYCYKDNMYFAISSRSTAISQKIKEDFKNCIEKNSHNKIDKFIYITNRTLKGIDWEKVDLLKKENPSKEIIIKDYKEIAKEISFMSKKEVQYILNKELDFEDSIYFSVEENTIESFTFKVAMKDSIFYISIMLLVIISLLIIFIFDILYYHNEAIMYGLVLSVFGIVFLVARKYRKMIAKNKYPHKILWLILFRNLHVGYEIIFDEYKHKFIRRISFWEFETYVRSSNCIKKGCCGKVYIYENIDTKSMIGKCEIDNFNHLYKIDNNFYGEPL